MNVSLRRLAVLGSLSWLVLGAGCSKSSGGHPGLAEGQLQCPDEYVAYDFGNAPIELDTENYVLQAGPDGGIPVYAPSSEGIAVTEALCVTYTETKIPLYKTLPNLNVTYQSGELTVVSFPELSATQTAKELAKAKIKCNGEGQCTVFSDVPTRYCSFSYTCGGDPSVKQTPRGVPGSSSWPVYPAQLSCASSPGAQEDARKVERNKAISCVPKNCRGKSHRDPSLNCVTDETMEVFSLDAMRLSAPSALTTQYNPEVTDAAQRVQTLYREAPYRYWATIDYGTTAPKSARMALWLSDVYVPKSVDVPAGANLDDVAARTDAKEVFRCSAYMLDMSRPADDDKATKVSTKIEEQLPSECFDQKSVEDGLGVLTGLDKPLDSYKFLGTRLNRSLDVVGRNVFLPTGVADANGNVCAPNPPAFFYDAVNSSYDTVAFYRQRQIDAMLTVDDTTDPFMKGGTTKMSTASSNMKVAHDFGGHGTWVSVNPHPGALRTGLQEVRTGDTELQVTNSRRPTQMSVDVSWFLAHAVPSHILYPGNQVVEGNDVVNGGYLYGQAADYVVSFYLWRTQGASGGAIDMPKLDEVKLSPNDVGPDGKVETVKINFPHAVRKMFFDSSSALYPQGADHTDSYELVACLDVRASTAFGYPAQRTDSRFFASSQQLSLGLSVGRADVFKRLPDGSLQRASAGVDYISYVTTRYNVAIGTGYPETPFTPWKGWGPGPGCRVASTPLAIQALTLNYPVQPLATEIDEDDSTDTDSGNSDMTASQGTADETTCQDANRMNCKESSNSNMESMGEMGRSFYNQDGALDHSSGSGVALDSDSEMLGTQLVDMADPMGEEDKTGWPADSDATHQASTPVTLKIAPPWDDIVRALRNRSRAKRGSPLVEEWETGRYAGIMGLGLGIGYKVHLQIGPIPGEVEITVSGGFATELSAELQFAPSEDDAYFCTGDTDCIGIETKALSFKAANEACAKKGGRLAELSEQVEANTVVSSAKAGGKKYWLGGQTTYALPDPACGSAWNASQCLSNAQMSYRWISNDVEFAYAKGGGAASYRASKFFGTQSAISSTLPEVSGLLYDGGAGSVSLAPMSEAHPYICRYTAENDYKFFKWSVAAELGVAAGIGASFCTPSSDLGFCIGGDLNVIALSLKPTYEHSYYWLLNSKKQVHAIAGFSSFTIPWGVTLLEGAMWAKIALLITEIEWNILEFDGFNVASGNLVEVHDQFRLKL